MGDTLAIALSLSRSRVPGLSVSSAKKRPAISKKAGGQGFKQATSNPDAVRSLWMLAPRSPLVGVPTGSVAGFDVLDIDYRSGGKEWEDANASRLPDTRIHQTMSGGRHYFFRHAPGVRNSASKVTLAPGIDIRGDGGYVIFPPSEGYTVINDCEPAEWPDWLLELVLARPMAAEKPVKADPVEIDSKRLAVYKIHPGACIRRRRGPEAHRPTQRRTEPQEGSYRPLASRQTAPSGCF